MKCPLQQAFCFSNSLLVTCPPRALEIFCQCFKARYLINKQIKKNHPAREQEKKKERIKVQTKDHTPKCRMHNGEKTRNPRPEPITSSTKQVM
jgi:hypothetical protein